MKRLVILGALVALTACGVDGEPVQPSGGVEVSLSSAGTSVGGTVRLSNGPLTLGLGY